MVSAWQISRQNHSLVLIRAVRKYDACGAVQTWSEAVKLHKQLRFTNSSDYESNISKVSMFND